ncbi:hypothetical protein TWF696_005823 [Orbilia brochopaga]|uniref:Major facilitator superfamily (MFS) profile domain-containing protein n=1 Tax=Orbilia brochopaga TaxID=3140254 RepID=A0AAV9UV80_9PEZI
MCKHGRGPARQKPVSLPPVHQLIMKWLNNPIINPFYRSEEEKTSNAAEEIRPLPPSSGSLGPELSEKEGVVQDGSNKDVENNSAPLSPEKSLDDFSSTDTQLGIQKVEAIATIWSKKELYAAFAWIWLGNFVFGLQNISSYSLFPYAYSDFNSHSLIPTSAIVAKIAGGVSRLFICKVIDIWGRAEGLVVFIVLILIGLVMFAATQGVATYAAAYVFYSVGFNGITYIISVFVADTTTLRNRALLFAFVQSPYLITTFLGPMLAQAWLDHTTWRWGFGAFCIIFPFLFVPFIVFLFRKQSAAFKAGLLQKKKSNRTLIQSLKHYAIEFDGSFLTTIGVFISFFSWDLYFFSFLQVVFDLSVTKAGYVSNVYSILSTVWCLIIGYLIRRTKRIKWICLIAAPFTIFGPGLMIYLRQPWQPIGLVVFCQVLIAFSGGALVIGPEVASLAVGTHNDVATILALMYLATSIGGAIGSSIAGAIWQNTFPALLVTALPADLKAEASKIVGSLPTQLSYPVGSPGRDAIVYAYSVAQQRMCIAATASGALALVGVWMWRDIRLDDKRQTKGTVL